MEEGKREERTREGGRTTMPLFRPSSSMRAQLTRIWRADSRCRREGGKGKEGGREGGREEGGSLKLVKDWSRARRREKERQGGREGVGREGRSIPGRR